MSETQSDLTPLLCDDRTREGNLILPANCQTRDSIRGNSESICADCKHVTDTCKEIPKRRLKVGGYNSITECTGFEDAGA